MTYFNEYYFPLDIERDLLINYFTKKMSKKKLTRRHNFNKVILRVSKSISY